VDLRDLIVTPLFILLILGAAYFIRPYVCNAFNYRFFLPALGVKIFSAIALGLLYQFYYNGGDTFNYHTHGSRVIWEIFTKNPLDGLSLIFLPQSWLSDSLQYTPLHRIIFFTDPASYFVVRVAAFIDLFTFSTYSATAVVFAVLCFAGSWMMFLAFARVYPHLLNWLALVIFFIPSVFFWGSGLLKDTLVMGALGASLYLIQSLLIMHRRRGLGSVLLLALCLVIIFMTKKYVLLCFAPAALLLIYMKKLFAIRSAMLRVLMVPALLGLLLVTSYYAVIKIGEGDARYSVERLAITAKITAYDIGFYTGRDAGSGYSIGELDGTFLGMLKLAPQAINVSLFRPYLWEVKNPLMLIAALESVVVLLLTFWVILRNPLRAIRSLEDPYVLFCMTFSITFAFAVGVSTFNFGTLVRYKIPMLSLYLTGLLLMYNYMKSARNVGVLERTE
jgi:hypothetical protein